jgi:hypothetical protein
MSLPLSKTPKTTTQEQVRSLRFVDALPHSISELLLPTSWSIEVKLEKILKPESEDGRLNEPEYIRFKDSRLVQLQSVAVAVRTPCIAL